MRSREQIQKEMNKGDYDRVAYIIGVTPRTVRAVIYNERKDYHGIVEAFNKLIDQRNQLQTDLRNQTIKSKVA